MRLHLLLALGAALAGGQDARHILAAKCYSCHGPNAQFSDLRLDSRDAILKGGQRGLAPDLIRAAIRHDGPLKMPPTGKLTAAEIAVIDQWLDNGFPLPAAKPQTQAPHWAFQPLKPVAQKPIIIFPNKPKTHLEQLCLPYSQKWSSSVDSQKPTKRA